MSSNGNSYITIKTSEINTVDFSQVIEARNTIRKSVDESEFIVKWVEGAPYMPSSIEAVPESDRSAVLSHSEALTLMATAEWTDPNPPQ
jgi:hypothetical protein